MSEFESQKELDQHKKVFGYVTSNDRALLVDPNGGTSGVPADNVQHYLDKGFRWPEAPTPPPLPEPKPIAGVTTTRRRRRRA